MKKLLFTALFLTSLLTKAQDAWDTTVTNGFNNGINFNFIKSFNGKLYVGGDSSHLSASRLAGGNTISGTPTGPVVLRIYSSTDGVNFNEETGFFNVAKNSDNISSVTAKNNLMFIGTSIESTLKIPQVYKYDGTTSTYTLHDTIHYDVTGGNTTPGVGGASIAALTLFSQSGTDSIYAFVNSSGDGFSGNYAPSIYKSSVNTPHWVNTTRFSQGSNILTINDAIVWHKRIYISTFIDSAGYYKSTILSSANGSTWDTISKADVVLQGVAGDGGNQFTKFEIHRDTLLVGLNTDYSGCTIPVWYTVDSLNTNPNWYGYVGVNANDAGITSQWTYGINSLKSFDNKLWITPNVYYSGVYSFDKQNGLRHSSGNAVLEQASNGNLLLEAFKNKIYNAGTTSSAGNLTNGNLSRLGLPVAAFVDSSYNGFCNGNSIAFYSTSLNASYLKWLVNDTLIGYGTPIYHAFNSLGTQNIKLIAYSTSDTSFTLVDSISQTITIKKAPIIDSFYTNLSHLPYQSVCQGQPVTLIASPDSANYAYSWFILNQTNSHRDTALGNSAVVTTFTTISSPPFGQGPPTYYVQLNLIDSHTGCRASSTNAIDFWVNQADSLSGLITLHNATHDSVSVGTVYLFQQKTTHVGVLDTTANYILSASPKGYFTFPNLYYGEYYLKAVADETTYPLSVGSYYNSDTIAADTAYQWDRATVITHHGCSASNDIYSIKVIETSTLTGTGTISGNIIKDPTFGQRLGNGGHNSVMGSPLKGVDVKLGKSPGGGCSARTTSGSTLGQDSGYYQFTNVDTGSYRIYVDIPNYGMDSVRLVHIAAGNNVSVENNYHVDSTLIYIDRSPTAGIITQSAVNAINIKVYPNPTSSVAYIDFYNKNSDVVNAQLYDLTGKQVAVLSNQKMQQGSQSIKINLVELQLPAGVYFIRATINGALQTFKLTVINN